MSVSAVADVQFLRFREIKEDQNERVKLLFEAQDLGKLYANGWGVSVTRDSLTVGDQTYHRVDLKKTSPDFSSLWERSKLVSNLCLSCLQACFGDPTGKSMKSHFDKISSAGPVSEMRGYITPVQYSEFVQNLPEK